jgi:hypothetical protein
MMGADMRSFTWNWVLKESYLKATGVGVSTDLRRIRVGPEESAREDGHWWNFHVDGVLAEGWAVRSWMVDCTHPAALALGPLSCSIDHPWSGGTPPTLEALASALNRALASPITFATVGDLLRAPRVLDPAEDEIVPAAVMTVSEGGSKELLLRP